MPDPNLVNPPSEILNIWAIVNVATSNPRSNSFMLLFVQKKALLAINLNAVQEKTWLSAEHSAALS